MSYYRPPPGPPPWQSSGPPPPWPPPPWRPRPSGTATAALTIALTSIPLYLIFGIVLAAATLALFGPVLGAAMLAAPAVLPLILGTVAIRDVKQRRAHPISRQRAILAMGISGLELFIGFVLLLSWLVEPTT